MYNVILISAILCFFVFSLSSGQGQVIEPEVGEFLVEPEVGEFYLWGKHPQPISPIPDNDGSRARAKLTKEFRHATSIVYYPSFEDFTFIVVGADEAKMSGFCRCSHFSFSDDGRVHEKQIKLVDLQYEVAKDFERIIELLMRTTKYEETGGAGLDGSTIEVFSKGWKYSGYFSCPVEKTAGALIERVIVLLIKATFEEGEFSTATLTNMKSTLRELELSIKNGGITAE